MRDNFPASSIKLERGRAFLSYLHALVGRRPDKEKVAALVAKHGLQRLEYGAPEATENRQLDCG